MKPRLLPALSGLAAALLCAQALPAQTVTVSGHVLVERGGGKDTKGRAPAVVVWLVPLEAGAEQPQRPRGEYTLTQRDKQFFPHMLVVPTGATVNFPNQDPFFHNVFSQFNGKRFDLGLYEGHTSRTVRFDREGISYIFCNIHPEMGAVVVSLNTPYHAISTAEGGVTIPGVPPGRYQVNVWTENAPNEELAKLSRILDLGPDRTTLPTLHIATRGDAMGEHRNKFGEAYPVTPPKTY